MNHFHGIPRAERLSVSEKAARLTSSALYMVARAGMYSYGIELPPSNQQQMDFALSQLQSIANKSAEQDETS